MNKAMAKGLRVKLEEAVGLLDTDALKVSVGSARYTSTSITFKVTISEVAADGVVMTPEARAYNQEREWRAETGWGDLYLPLGSVFSGMDGRRFSIVGLSTRAKKYPILAVDTVTGVRYKFPARVAVDHAAVAALAEDAR